MTCTVHFRRKEITIYPDDTHKPAVGEGLNKKAEVTLDRTWPTDKTSRKPITVSHFIKATFQYICFRNIPPVDIKPGNGMISGQL